MQRARWCPVRVALDPAVFRIGRVAVDPGELERPAVDPGGMAVAVREDGRPIGDDPIEVLAARRAVLEIGHVPAAADDPWEIRVRRGVGSDRRQDAVPAARLANVALELIDPAADRMDVGVLEAGQEEPARQVDDPRLRADVFSDLGRGPDRDDPLASDGDGCGPRLRGVDGMDVAAGEHEVGGTPGMRHRPRMTSRATRPLDRRGPRDAPRSAAEARRRLCSAP